jgi:hypothetical protein
MSKIKIFLPAAILLGGFLAYTTASFGTIDDAKKSKKSCAYCHTQASPPKKGDPKASDLKDAGKYWKEKKTLDGYVEKK